jgi:hypothetical protein
VPGFRGTAARLGGQVGGLKETAEARAKQYEGLKGEGLENAIKGFTGRSFIPNTERDAAYLLRLSKDLKTLGRLTAEAEKRAKTGDNGLQDRMEKIYQAGAKAGVIDSIRDIRPDIVDKATGKPIDEVMSKIQKTESIDASALERPDVAGYISKRGAARLGMEGTQEQRDRFIDGLTEALKSTKITITSTVRGAPLGPMDVPAFISMTKELDDKKKDAKDRGDMAEFNLLRDEVNKLNADLATAQTAFDKRDKAAYENYKVTATNTVWQVT